MGSPARKLSGIDEICEGQDDRGATHGTVFEGSDNPFFTTLAAGKLTLAGNLQVLEVAPSNIPDRAFVWLKLGHGPDLIAIEIKDGLEELTVLALERERKPIETVT